MEDNGDFTYHIIPGDQLDDGVLHDIAALLQEGVSTADSI